MEIRNTIFAAMAALAIASPAAADQRVSYDFDALLKQMQTVKSKTELQLVPIPMQGRESPGQHDCFWMGPVYAGAFNVAYPDGGAVYWVTAFEMPEMPGAMLEIKGSFPQARYMSMHSYTEGAAPYDHLRDIDIAPDAGAQNPFISGTYEGARNYTLRVVSGAVPQSREANTIYLGPADKIDRTPLLLRHYIPETGDDLTGGTALPEVALVMPDGSRVTGQAMCDAVGSPAPDSPARAGVGPMLTQAQFDEMLAKPEVAESYLNEKKEDWSVFWDPRINIMALVSPRLQEVMKTAARVGMIEKTSGFYANLDNEYVNMNLNDKFGEVVVLEAKMPRTAIIGTDAAAVDEIDLRYWSLCTNESLVTTKFSACIYDSQVALDDARGYTIVISKAANRPVNARPECGVTWLDWGDAGDGAGHPGITSLILRNMDPNPNFAHAVQRIPGPGLESQTMGPYLPKPVYTTRASFEGRGC